jgi:hypothetical protein
MTQAGKDKVSVALRRFHLIAVVVWTLLLVPSLLWWKASVLWVVLMSVWANIQGHFASYMAAQTEQREMDREDDS